MAEYEKVFFDFKIESISGEIINLNEYSNKVVLLVNTASYTSDDGTTQTTLGVFAQNVGEIINIYCGFYDDCDSHFSDHIQVEVVDNE